MAHIPLLGMQTKCLDGKHPHLSNFQKGSLSLDREMTQKFLLDGDEIDIIVLIK